MFGILALPKHRVRRDRAQQDEDQRGGREDDGPASPALTAPSGAGRRSRGGLLRRRLAVLFGGWGSETGGAALARLPGVGRVAFPSRSWTSSAVGRLSGFFSMHSRMRASTSRLKEAPRTLGVVGGRETCWLATSMGVPANGAWPVAAW